MKRRTHLEGGLVVEMQNGETRLLACTPFDGNVIHRGIGDGAFSPATVTPEDEFRSNVKRVTSRSRFSTC